MWLILGGGGQLGQTFHEVFSENKIEHVSLERRSCDVSQLDSIQANFKKYNPAFVVNCAAWTAVDDAEDHTDSAFLINRDGARNVAMLCSERNIKLVHISTDYVFDGFGEVPYSESDAVGPVSVYGKSKLAGELAVLKEHGERSLIVRTAWLYSKFGKNFVKTMTKKALQQQDIQVVNDQVGQPSWTNDLVKHVHELATLDSTSGIFHGTNSGQTTWYDLTVEIYKSLGVDTSLISPIPSSAFPTKASRPKNSVLSHTRTTNTGVSELRDWKMALHESIIQIRDAVEEEIRNDY